MPTPPPTVPEAVPAVAHVVAPEPARPRLPWYAAVGSYLAAAALTVGLLVAGLRLDKADFSAPFTYTLDSLLILPFVKATLERGSHWRNERLGAPGIQELHDFPVVDHLHFGVIWLIGRFESDPVVVFNLFYVLTYPLTTVTAMAVLRSFGLSVPAAGAGGVLYAFQPYHYLRGEIHYFLAAYYVVPLTVMVGLWVTQGRLPFFRKHDVSGRYDFRPLTRDTLAAVVIAAATASAGAYYAFFACVLLSCAAVIGWVTVRSWRAAAAGAAVVAVVVAGGVVNHWPAFAYQRANGPNTGPTQRWPEESEMYGMKIIQLVLPVADHNPVGVGGTVLLDVASVRARYLSELRPLNEYYETEYDPMGAVASVGLVGLLAYCVLPVRRAWPLAPVAGLAAFATLFGTVGGFGDLFNLLVTAQVRCHNRICIYIAFLSLFAVCWVLDRFFDGRAGWGRRLRWPAFVALGAFGVWDQTDSHWFPQTRSADPNYQGADDRRDEDGDAWRADRAFFGRVEDVLPEGMVFCYPFVPYPEAVPYGEAGSADETAAYDMARGYLHTARLRWSFGAMRGREWDRWARTAAVRPPREMLVRAVLAGFDGLLVDRRGLNPKRFDFIRRELDQVLGRESPRVIDDALGLSFYDLRGYRHDLIGGYGPAGFAARAEAELTSLDKSVLWLKGFSSYEPHGFEDRQRWCRSEGLMVLLNPTDQPRRARVSMAFESWFEQPGVLRIDGGDVWADVVEISTKPRVYSKELVIPPGQHRVWFRCRPPTGSVFADTRELVFSVRDFRIEPTGP